jgi:hypothetical protein
MDSLSVKQTPSYTVVKSLLSSILSTEGQAGSILLGKRYANKYNTLIDTMLEGPRLNPVMLDAMLEQIDDDIRSVRMDSSKRIPSQYTVANNEMISMVADFLKSI